MLKSIQRLVIALKVAFPIYLPRLFSSERRNFQVSSIYLKNTVFLAASSLPLFFSVACARSPSFLNKVSQVKVGMTQSQVVELLGEPDAVAALSLEVKGKEETWAYYPHFGADKYKAFTFDLQTKRVIGLQELDDDYFY